MFAGAPPVALAFERCTHEQPTKSRVARLDVTSVRRPPGTVRSGSLFSPPLARVVHARVWHSRCA